MTCRKVGAWIGLAAGGDLDERRRQKLERHMERCVECRKEYERTARTIEAVKTLAREERTPEWSESEWRGLMARATSQAFEKRGARFLGFPGWAWSAASALLVILVVGGVILLRHAPERGPISVQAARRDFVLPEIRRPAAAGKPAAPPLASKQGPSPTEIASAARGKAAAPTLAPSAPAPSLAQTAPAPLLAQATPATGKAQPSPAMRKVGAPPALSASAKPQPQTVMAMTFVSQDTGLKIYWVFNDAFHYEENKK